MYVITWKTKTWCRKLGDYVCRTIVGLSRYQTRLDADKQAKDWAKIFGKKGNTYFIDKTA